MNAPVNRAAVQSALQATQEMASSLQADLAARECAAQAPNWGGRALLWSLRARIEELQAQLHAATAELINRPERCA